MLGIFSSSYMLPPLFKGGWWWWRRTTERVFFLVLAWGHELTAVPTCDGRNVKRTKGKRGNLKRRWGRQGGRDSGGEGRSIFLRRFLSVQGGIPLFLSSLDPLLHFLLPPSILICHFSPEQVADWHAPYTANTPLAFLSFSNTCLFLHAPTWWLSQSIAVPFFYRQQKMFNEFHPFFSEVNTAAFTVPCNCSQRLPVARDRNSSGGASRRRRREGGKWGWGVGWRGWSEWGEMEVKG